MKDDAGKWDRNEYFCVFLLFVAINVRSADPRPNALIHLSVDQTMLPCRFETACTRAVSLARIRALMKL